MAQHENHASQGGFTGQLAIIGGASAILLAGLYFLWSSNAPYHPEVQGEPLISTDASTRFDGTLLD